MAEVNLGVEFCGIKFPNPFMLSSAPPTTTGEMMGRAFEAGWGGAVTKTMALEKVEVINVTPRLTSLAFEGFGDEPRKLYGLENIEMITDRPLGVWLEEIEDLRRKYPGNVVIGSIMAEGSSSEDWKELAMKVEKAGAQMLELNFSCPHGGIPGKCVGKAIGQDPHVAADITRWVKEVVKVPVMVKLTPNITDVTVVAKAVQDAGADAVSAINTVSAFFGVDLETLEPKPSVWGYTTFGGYSGPGVKPIALRIMLELARSMKIPISGIGGIETWQDAAEFILCGATTIQVCTAAMMHGYDIIADMLEGLENFMEEKGFGSIPDMRGKILDKVVEFSRLDADRRVVSTIDRSLCIKDDLCYIACRDAGYQAISLDEARMPAVDEDKCTGCSLCMQVCPVWDCISMKERSVVK
ncbi:MAG: NAD-dependent dihydropyrimidine dehydrogenase subunit PreA [Chloroflexi bacterium]|nr:NAD-dependent dihydropyrimidine dehydrogenase subunit PreA [Chloroflexota bacterium]